jgi:hypothetical protein
MRSVGLDLGLRHIAFCEVKDGKVVVVERVRSLSQLASRLGPWSAEVLTKVALIRKVAMPAFP